MNSDDVQSVVMRSDSAPRAWSRRGMTRGAVVLCLVIAGTMVPLAPAYAHDQIVSQDPAAEQRLDVAPDTITLTFSAEPLDVGSIIRIVDPAWTEWAEAASQIDGTSVVQPLQAGMPDGVYEVRWRVVSADGHPLSDSFRFLVGENTSDDLLTQRFPDPGEGATAAIEETTPSAAPDSRAAGAVSFAAGGAVLVTLVLVVLARRGRIRRPRGRGSASSTGQHG